MTYGDQPDPHAGCKERIAELERERDEYRRRLAHAESCVDEAFTTTPGKARPILPGFVPPDGNKFDAVKVLARKYRATIVQLLSIADWSDV